MNNRNQYWIGGVDVKRILLVGLAGGFAEIVWVLAIAMVIPLNTAELARQVTASVLPVFSASSMSVSIGIAIHLALSVSLAAVYLLTVGIMLEKYSGPAGQVIAGMLTLVVVWAVNFMLVLPVVNPAFILLVGYPVAFISKVLFGIAMTATNLLYSRFSTVIPAAGHTVIMY